MDHGSSTPDDAPPSNTLLEEARATIIQLRALNSILCLSHARFCEIPVKKLSFQQIAARENAQMALHEVDAKVVESALARAAPPPPTLPSKRGRSPAQHSNQNQSPSQQILTPGRRAPSATSKATPSPTAAPAPAPAATHAHKPAAVSRVTSSKSSNQPVATRSPPHTPLPLSISGAAPFATSASSVTPSPQPHLFAVPNSPVPKSTGGRAHQRHQSQVF